MLVKICGITNLEDALSAVDAGAGALGFNFYPRSPRYLEPKSARQIIDQLPANILSVGVFVNEESPAMVEGIAKTAGVSAVQLHGDEPAEFCRQLQIPFVIKTLAVVPDFDPRTASEFPVDAILLDAFSRQARGGTGQTVDWEVAARTRELVPKLFLAGGLSPSNITAAIRAVQPFAVDACSALEARPGKKDPSLVRAFVQSALAA